MNWPEIFQYIPPTNVALLIVILIQFYASDKKDKMIERLGDIVHRNSEVTTNQSTMIQTLLGARP